MNWLIAGLTILALGVLGLIVYGNYLDVKDCEERGGVQHCVSGNTSDGHITTTCDCYTKDGRVLIRP